MEGLPFEQQPSWIEGRVEVETQPVAGSSTQQQIDPANAEEDVQDAEGHHFISATTWSERERLLLLTTEAEERRGAVRLIACKLCPARRFGSWATFKRHCKECEDHPLESKIAFCTLCGDYHARGDSNGRHGKGCSQKSLEVIAEKRRTVLRIIEVFEPRLMHCLRTGQEVGPRFRDIVNKMLPDSSKKVPRREWSEADYAWVHALL